jgi:agmatinase
MSNPFDPDAAAVGDGIFGLPHTPDESDVVLVPVPWEATTSYGTGTANGPEAILRASKQLDLSDRETGRPFDHGIAMLPIPSELHEKRARARSLAEPVIAAGSPGDDSALVEAAAEVDALCREMNEWVHSTSKQWLERRKLVGVVGGDHSVSYGLIQAVAERHPGMGVLHLDAHADLRVAYEGFTWSHASIMNNVLRLSSVGRIVQVGIRDFSPQEDEIIRANPDRLRSFFDPDLKARAQTGEPWRTVVGEIVEALPNEVHLSFDIDGLDPTLCPHTGTPVPGGLSFPQTTGLIRAVVESGRQIVGLDLTEVAPDPSGQSEWDGNVGARLLYKMIGFALMTRGASGSN